MGGAHRSFPHFAFLQFTVAQKCVDARGILLQLQAHRHAQRHGKSLAKRARAGFDPGQVEDMRMALEWASELAQIESGARVAKAVTRGNGI